jgi:hypothetical protein
METAEQALGRQLTYDEVDLVVKMHRSGKDEGYIIKVLGEGVPEAPADEELITTAYELSAGGPQDITHLAPAASE